MTTKHKSKRNREDLTPPEPQSNLVQASSQYVLQSRTKGNGSFVGPESTAGKNVANDLLQSELKAARLLNVDMPDEPKAFIRLLESRVQAITQTQKNVILILDEVSGTYTCLNDEQYDHIDRPRELTWISDHYLQDLLGSEQVIHSFLHHQGNIFGIIAIADKVDGTLLSVRDEMVLEQLTQYLSVQVNHFLALKHSMALPNIQRILLHISNRLLSAVDSTAIYQGALTTLCQELHFQAGQYIHLEPQTGKGQVLYQMVDNQFGLGDPVWRVNQFASLLSLFQSQVWQNAYLYLKGEFLGDRTFSEIFNIPDVQSVVLLPLNDTSGKLTGAMVLFQQGQLAPLSKEALKVLEQVSELVTSACSRAKVLEKALEIATTDELTGAVNRRGFYSRFDAEVERARRNQTPMCLAMIDIDRFKPFNDNYGHLVGDVILRLFSKHLEKNIRKSDILCRFGGEEFALLLPETTLQAATDLVERLREKIAKQRFATPAGQLKVTFSAGVSLVETTQGLSKESTEVISDALASADELLYLAKKQGRNQIQSA